MYVDIAKEALERKVSVDLFIYNSDYYDLPTIGVLSTLTGGSIYKYKTYNTDRDSESLYYELYRNLTRTYAYDI